MGLETDADRCAYVAAFGVPVSCDAGQLTAIYDNPLADALDIQGTAPALQLPTADVEKFALAPGARVTVQLPGGPAMYRVRRHEPDAEGWSVLVLTE